MATPSWHGTQAESIDLQKAIQNNCTCEFDTQTGERTKTCPPHKIMLEDQRTMNGLLFMRRQSESLIREEFDDKK